jgi:glycosyltransferase involved in cell wall biosynthesis
VFAVIVNSSKEASTLELSLNNLRIAKVIQVGAREKWKVNPSFIGGKIIRELFSCFSNKVDLEERALASLRQLIQSTAQFEVFVFRIHTFPIYQKIFSSILIQHRLTLDWDDIESTALQRENETNKFSFGKEVYWSNKIRIKKTQKMESDTVDKCSSILVCSEKDAKSMNYQYSTDIFFSIPNSFDFQSSSVTKAVQDDGVVNILFVGSMYYPPNEHGAIWFCKDVLPIILSGTNVKVVVWIVGYKPTESVQKLAEIDNVVVTGSVDSITDYYAKATFAVSPIHFGGGTRIKILEAASFKVPTVTTSIGLEGIDFKHMSEVLVADTVKDFAASCLMLVEQRTLGEKLSNSAFIAGKKLYDHSVVTDTLSSLIK